MLSFDFNQYMVPLIGAAITSAGLAGIGWRRRHVQGARTFVFLMVVLAIHAFSYAFELASRNIETAQFVIKFEYVGISFLGLSYFLHILAYTGNIEKVGKLWLRLSFVIPIITILLVWTNDRYHLIWQSFTLDMSRGFTVWRSVFGPWFWVHFVYSYGLILLSILLLGRAVLQSPTTYKRHLMALFIAVAAPLAGNIFLFVMGPAIDPTPFMFTISGLAMAWVMFWEHYLELVPVAREQVLLQLQDGVIILDSYSQILDMNPAAERILAVSKRDVMGTPLIDLLPTITEWHDVYTHMVVQEITMCVADTNRTYRVEVTPLYGQWVNGRLATLHDITRQQQTAQALREARDVAQRATKAKTTFLANMSHELRTPLSVILGYTELIEAALANESNPVSKVVIDRLNKIHTSGDHLLTIINDVLDFSRLESGRTQIEMRPFSLDHLLTAVVTMAEPLIKANGNVLVTDIGSMGMIATDEVKLRQILMNLLNNAGKFTQEGRVSLITQRSPTSVRFEIRDTGIGMSETQMAQLFQPFMQADVSTTRKHGGAGLGLMISQRFARLLGGRIEVRSQLGEGSTFVLTLPVSSVTVDGSVAPAKAEEQTVIEVPFSV